MIVKLSDINVYFQQTDAFFEVSITWTDSYLRRTVHWTDKKLFLSFFDKINGIRSFGKGNWVIWTRDKRTEQNRTKKVQEPTLYMS